MSKGSSKKSPPKTSIKSESWKLPKCKDEDKECQKMYRYMLSVSAQKESKRVGHPISERGGGRATRRRKSRRQRQK